MSDVLVAINPSTGEQIEGEYPNNSLEELNDKVEAAKLAFAVLRKTSGEERAILLETMADEIEALGDRLVKRATAETGLPEARIIGERGRTVGQLRLFASMAREGSWVEASIDTAIPDRQPLPKSDLRKMAIGIGPVAIFAASNFPLAFSTAGGDTASALAGGNPVIVKGHSSHIGTHALVTEALEAAVEKCNMPKGVFASVIGPGKTIGQELVKHPGIKAVGFTGSFMGGKALFDLANSRHEPIPVYAEMSSINPVVVMKEALEKRGDAIATSLAGSICLGVGQFCTNPGLILGIDGPELDQFEKSLAEAIKKSVGGVMLNEHIKNTYDSQAVKLSTQKDVAVLGEGTVADGKFTGKPIVAKTSAKSFVSNPKLAEEVFGPYSMVIRCADEDELAEVLATMEGQLTTSFMAEESELEEFEYLVAIAEQKAGRVIFNGVPTGVEVCHSMVHGGPFPATTDSKFTSVGADAIKRFVRPVCYQDAPDSILPQELQKDNPLGIWRKVNGSLTKDPA